MQVIISSSEFKRIILVASSLIGRGRDEDPKILDNIQLDIGKGLIVSYSSNSFGVTKCRTKVNYLDDIQTVYIGIPRILPKADEDVTISVGIDVVIVSFGNVSFTYKQEKYKNKLSDLFNKVNEPYEDKVKKDVCEDNAEGKLINKVYLNEQYVYSIMLALHKVKNKNKKISIEVESVTNRAARITADHGNIEIFLLPMIPDSY